MNVLHITGKYRPVHDGLSNYVYNLTVRLANQNHNITVLTFDLLKRINIIKAKKINKINEILNRVNVVRLRTKPPYLPYFWSYYASPKLFKIDTLKPDLIHIHSYMQFHSDLSMLLSYKYRIPSVVTIHAYGYSSMKYFSYLSKIYHKTLVKKTLTKVNKIIVLDPLAKIFFSKLIEPSKITVIPNGIDYDRFSLNLNVSDRCRIKELLGIQGNVILFTGLLIKRKGVDTIIKAMPYILKDHPLTYLLIIGSGPEMGKLIYLTDKMNVRKNVKFLGFVSEKVLPLFYAISDIFVLPSYHEGLPTSILEAMAAGLPVISTPVGGISYLLKKYDIGKLIEPGNYKQLANSVIELMLDPSLRKKISDKARSVAKQFDWNTIVYRIENLYYDIMVSN